MKIFDWLWKRHYVKNPGLKDGFCSPMSCRRPKIYKPLPHSMSRAVTYHSLGCRDAWIFPPKNAILSTDYLKSGDGMARNDLCVCGSGIKQKHCHSTIADGSALMGLWQKYTALEAEIEKQRRANNTCFVCKQGCTDCCSDYFYISLLEFIAIKHHMLTFGNDDFLKSRAKAMAQYSWLQQMHPDEYKRLENLPSLQEMYDDHAIIERAMPCPLLKENGDCAAYVCRPFICRLHGISSAYTICGRVETKLNNSLFKPTLSSLLVDIEYSEELLWNVDRFQKKNGIIAFPKLAPIMYWLFHEQEYQAIYEIACSRSLSEYSEKC